MKNLIPVLLVMFVFNPLAMASSTEELETALSEEVGIPVVGIGYREMKSHEYRTGAYESLESLNPADVNCIVSSLPNMVRQIYKMQARATIQSIRFIFHVTPSEVHLAGLIGGKSQSIRGLSVEIIQQDEYRNLSSRQREIRLPESMLKLAYWEHGLDVRSTSCQWLVDRYP